jgi:predicted O-methyltransferase YrrM
MIEVRNTVKSLLDKFDFVNCIETGTIRSYDEKHESTRHISEVLQNKGHLKSIDNSEKSLAISKDICKNAPNVEWILSDSLEYLKQDKDIYHFVFLDSVNDANHILEEFKLIIDRIHDGGILIIDDSGINMHPLEPAQKGIAVGNFLYNAKIEFGLLQASHCTQLILQITKDTQDRIKQLIS